jgi:hypothetical protein
VSRASCMRPARAAACAIKTSTVSVTLTPVSMHPPDPLDIGAADLMNPQSLNRYAYVMNDPADLNDPSGMDFGDDDWGIGGGCDWCLGGSTGIPSIPGWSGTSLPGSSQAPNPATFIIADNWGSSYGSLSGGQGGEPAADPANPFTADPIKQAMREALRSYPACRKLFGGDVAANRLISQMVAVHYPFNSYWSDIPGSASAATRSWNTIGQSNAGVVIYYSITVYPTSGPGGSWTGGRYLTIVGNQFANDLSLPQQETQFFHEIGHPFTGEPEQVMHASGIYDYNDIARACGTGPINGTPISGQ